MLATLLLALSGCALLTPEAPTSPPVEPETPVPVTEPAPQVDVQPAKEPAPAVPLPATPQPVSERVAVVLTGSLPAYTRVANELVGWLEDYRIYDLGDRSRSPRQVFESIAGSEAKLVVAIGLSAAKFARSFSTVPVVFSQVFNIEDHGLKSDSMRGVAMLPPMTLQAEAWRAMDPRIKNVGAIVGEGHEELIAETERAMASQGITLHHAIAKSDRETLYHFKRLVYDLDGFLLFPDNRILSRAVFAEVMSDAARHRVQVAVFNESLLKHGATFSASAVESDIAGKITITLNEIGDGLSRDNERLTPLSEIRIQTNPAMLRTFGLDVTDLEISNSIAEAQ